MRIGIVHYHLRGGGVTRVIQNASALLARRGVDVTVFSGEEPATPWEQPIRVIPGLGYDEAGDVSVLEAGFDSIPASEQPDLWHFHNPTLGKNAAISKLIRRMVDNGKHVLLQIHDFAEDGRPQNYSRLRPALENEPRSVYPRCSHAHYAVINERDERTLYNSDALPGTVHLLPHPAMILDTPDRDLQSAPINEPFAFAPVRGIRRKNLGELGLLALLDPQKATYATSLAVNDGESAEHHKRWREFFAHHAINVRLGAAEPDRCQTLAAAARNFVSTSVSEGFGLAFLEAALFNKPLSGRDLPEITGMFQRGRKSRSPLYRNLWIPDALFDHSSFVSRLRSGLTAIWELYGRAPSESDFARALGAISRERLVDFAGLDEELQRNVLVKLLGNGSRVILDNNPNLQLTPPLEDPVLLGDFGMSRYVDRLIKTYETLARSEVSQRVKSLDWQRLLNTFLAPERFRLILS
jgi:glycosyltransferase involved in cell wall biosynthesis